jgi:hypothetical protein
LASFPSGLIFFFTGKRGEFEERIFASEGEKARKALQASKYTKIIG